MRGDNFNAELFNSGKVSDIIRDYKVGLALDGEFQNKVIFRVGQERTPEIENLSEISFGADKIEDVIDFNLAQAQS